MNICVCTYQVHWVCGRPTTGPCDTSWVLRRDPAAKSSTCTSSNGLEEGVFFSRLSTAQVCIAEVRSCKVENMTTLLKQTCGGILRLWAICCGQSVTASDIRSNGPRFESGRGRCVESLDKALYLPLSQGEAFTLASISYLAILVKYILAKKKKKFLDYLEACYPKRGILMSYSGSSWRICMIELDVAYVKVYTFIVIIIIINFFLFFPSIFFFGSKDPNSLTGYYLQRIAILFEGSNSVSGKYAHNIGNGLANSNSNLKSSWHYMLLLLSVLLYEPVDKNFKPMSADEDQLYFLLGMGPYN